MSPPCLTKNSEVCGKSGCEAYVRKKKSGRLRVNGKDINLVSLIKTSISSLCFCNDGALREQMSKPLFEPEFLISLEYV